MVIPQCETVGALEHIEEIVSINGVDGIFIGPYDLSIAMGIPGEFQKPDIQDALKHVLETCRRHQKPCILFTGTAEGVQEGFEQGFDCMAYGIDASLIIEGIREKIETINR